MAGARVLAPAAALLATLLPLAATAFDTDADDYVSSPAGTTVALFYFQHVERDAQYVDGRRVPGAPSLTTDTGILRLAHLVSAGGYLLDPQLLLPFGSQQAGGTLAGWGHTEGVADLIVGNTVWLLDQPKTNNYAGISTFVSVPTGDYDRNRALNWGENRWKLTLQGGWQHALDAQWSAVMIGDGTFFTGNTDYGATGATLRQRPQWQGQFYLRYTASERVDTFVGYSFTVGGETSIDGVDQHDRQRQSKFTIGGGYFFTPQIELFGAYGHDFSTANALRESNRFNLRVSRSF